jgi:hypothetical protein
VTVRADFLMRKMISEIGQIQRKLFSLLSRVKSVITLMGRPVVLKEVDLATAYIRDADKDT